MVSRNFCQKEYSSIILLHDRFEGGIDIANPKGPIFHPKGQSPEGWNGSQEFAKIICLPIGDHAIVLLRSLLNEKSTQTYSYVIHFAALPLGFTEKILQIDRNCFAKDCNFPSIWRNLLHSLGFAKVLQPLGVQNFCTPAT